MREVTRKIESQIYVGRPKAGVAEEINYKRKTRIQK